MSRAQFAVSMAPQPNERRTGTVRTSVNAASTMRTAGTARDVLVEDLSSTGFRFQSGEPVAIGTRLHIGLAGAGTAQARVVRSDAESHGCEFVTPLDDARLRLAFSGNVLLAPDFGGAAAATVLPYRDNRYSGAVRVIVAFGGAAFCWAGVIFAGVRALG